MIEDQLNIIKKYKKTTDLFTKPLVLLNSSDLSIEEIEESLKFQTKYSNKNIDRHSLTHKQEITFQIKMSKYLRDLLPKMEEFGIENLLDFHIKYHKIDKINKEDLLFLLLPFNKFNEQKRILMSLEEYNIQILAKQLNKLEFLEFFICYFDFIDLLNIREFIWKVLMCYLDQQNWLKDLFVEVLMGKISELKENKFYKKIYEKLITKTDLRIEGIKEDIDLINNKEHINLINNKEPINLINNKEPIDLMTEFFNILNEENYLKILNEVTELFKEENKIEIITQLLKYEKPNFFPMLEYLTINDVESLFLSKKNILKNYINNLYELIYLKDKNKFKSLFLSKKIIKKDILIYLLKRELFEYEDILNLNLNKIYKIIKENKTNLNFSLYAFADYQCNIKYNEIIENLIKMKKLPILDLNKISEENKKSILLEPEIFIENQIEDILIKITNKSNKPIVIKKEIDLINLEGIEKKVTEYVINKLKTETSKYLKYLLQPPLNRYLLDYINHKSVQIILEQICIDSTDENWYLMIIENMLINKKKLIKNQNYFEEIINKEIKSKELKYIFENNLKYYLNSECNEEVSINLRVIGISLSLDIQLMPYLNNIFKLLEIENEPNLLYKLIKKYKKVLTPYLNHIIKYSNINEIKIFNGCDVIEILKEPLLLDYLNEVEITEDMFDILKDNLTIPIIEIILLKNSIINNSNYIYEFLIKINEKERMEFINKTINEKNINFFKIFYEFLYENFELNEISKICFNKFLNYALDYEINHELLINKIIKNETQIETIAYILKHKNNKEFSLNFNKRILKEFKNEELKLLNLLNSIYKIFPEYKICLEETMPFFINLLESEDEKLRIKTENLLTKINLKNDFFN